MNKRILATLLLSFMALICASCGTKTLLCDGCGKELTVSNSSNMEDDWIVFCKECEEELFADNPVVEESN